ncbi:MAG: Nif3-like dinuclear metal center hexameric protein [Desulfobacteraceae bacterium]|nr:Nif3-like dinuclear metal center hexameric protein [Desulfobacteraceae bacterium]
MKVSDIMEIMAKIAPPHLAEDWDNPGLQFGGPDWPVSQVFIALEPTSAAVSRACQAGADMLITHHPLIFKPLKKIDTTSPLGAIIEKAARSRLAIFAAHTNLDSVDGGVNDVLCQKLGLENLSALCPADPAEQYKFVVFVPEDYAGAVIEAVGESPAGRIGNYSCCTFRSQGTGTFRPGQGADPWDGEIGVLSEAREVRLETVVDKAGLKETFERVRAAHPYDEMAYDVYPLAGQACEHGLGRIGDIDPPRKLSQLAREIKENFSLDSVRFSGPEELVINKAAVCSGSGGGIMEQFLAADAQVLISGDIRYHDAINAAEAGRAIIDMGHFASERLIVPVIRQKLEDALKDAGQEVRITELQGEADPFVFI